MNVRFTCDGEEETGGHSIVEFLAADERGADAAIIFDGGMIRPRRAGVQRRDARDRLLPRHAAYRRARLHSGHLRRRGAERGARARSQALAGAPRARRAARRAAAEGIVPPTEEELAGWRELPTGADELADQGARPADARAAEEFYLRTFAEPALDVNGHRERLAAAAEDGAAGRGESRTCRSGSRPARTSRRSRPSVERLLREAAPEGAELEIELLVVVAAGARAARRAGDPARVRTRSSASSAAGRR